MDKNLLPFWLFVVNQLRRSLSAPTRREIAVAVGTALSELSSLSVGGNREVSRYAGALRIAESLEVWHLRGVAAPWWNEYALDMAIDFRLAEFAINTTCWHHQIRAAGVKSVCFSHSSIKMSGAKKVVRIERVDSSPISSAVDAALRVATEKVRVLSEVRAKLLIFPELNVWALWLEGKRQDHLILVTQPGRTYRLQKRKMYEWRDFLSVIRRKALRARSTVEALDQMARDPANEPRIEKPPESLA